MQDFFPLFHFLFVIISREKYRRNDFTIVAATASTIVQLFLFYILFQFQLRRRSSTFFSFLSSYFKVISHSLADCYCFYSLVFLNEIFFKNFSPKKFSNWKHLGYSSITIIIDLYFFGSKILIGINPCKMSYTKLLSSNYNYVIHVHISIYILIFDRPKFFCIKLSIQKEKFCKNKYGTFWV